MDGMKKEKTVTANSRRSFWLSFGAKSTSVFLGALVFFYILTGSFLDSGFLKRDLAEKYGRVAGATSTVLSVKFVGPPNPPVLTATPICLNYVSYVNLSWTTDDQMDYFDISRDGSPLVSGITQDFYNDYAIDILTDYVYEVTTFNIAGQATSNFASATTLDCGTPPLPDPVCEVTRFDTINLAGFVGVPATKNRSPVFYGTSNIEYAIIDVIVGGATSVLAVTSTNDNGYWTWSPITPFNYGEHTIWATVIDPNDSARRVTNSLNFKIETAPVTDDDDDDDDDAASDENADKKEEPIWVPVVPPRPVELSPEKDPIAQLSMEIKNPEKIAYPGKNLSVETKLEVMGDATGEESELYYFIVDDKYREVFRDFDKVTIDGDKLIVRELEIPGLLKPGKYKLLTSVRYRGTIITVEDDFTLKEIPLVSLGGGVTITTGQVMRNLLWVIIWCSLTLLVFLGLLSIEYWISRNAIIEITEEMLSGQRLITKRKI
jgi:hypothetical protein